MKTCYRISEVGGNETNIFFRMKDAVTFLKDIVESGRNPFLKVEECSYDKGNIQRTCMLCAGFVQTIFNS